MLSVDKLLGLAGVGSTIANVSPAPPLPVGRRRRDRPNRHYCSTMAGMLLIAGFIYALYLSLSPCITVLILSSPPLPSVAQRC